MRVNNPSATVDDLARALDPTGARALLIDGRPVDRDLDLIEGGLHEGAEVRFAPASLAGRGPLAATDLGVEPAAHELVVVNGLDAGRRFPLRPGTVVVGRAPGCEVVLPDTTLSRRHVALTLSADGEITVDDLESHNGTWVDGEAVTAPVTLAPGASCASAPSSSRCARSTTTTARSATTPAGRPAPPGPSRSTARPARPCRCPRPTSPGPSRRTPARARCRCRSSA